MVALASGRNGSIITFFQVASLIMVDYLQLCTNQNKTKKSKWYVKYRYTLKHDTYEAVESHLYSILCFCSQSMNPPHFTEHGTIAKSETNGQKPGSSLANELIHGWRYNLAI